MPWVGVERDIVTVVGDDARSYLHGQVSQDIQSLGIGESRWTLVLAPNGRVEVLARVLCVGDDRFELDTEAGYGDILAARLNRFRIRVKADLEQSTDARSTSTLVSPPCRNPLRRLTNPASGGGTRVSGWTHRLPEHSATGTIEDYERARIDAGWPAMGSEIVPGERIPAEVAVVPVTVNFTKGCYPGQELVERMDSRGSEAPRQLRIIEVSNGAKTGDPVADPDDPAGPAIGEITSVAGARALAYVKRGVGVGEVPGPANC